MWSRCGSVRVRRPTGYACCGPGLAEGPIRSIDLQEGIDDGGMRAFPTEMLNQVAQALAGAGSPQLFKGDRKHNHRIKVAARKVVSGWKRHFANESMIRRFPTYTESFLIMSLKESSSRISGSLQASKRWPIGEGERGGSSAPGCLRDLTRIGIVTSQLSRREGSCTKTQRLGEGRDNRKSNGLRSR